MADHIQRVLKPNFGAAWDEVGDEFEKEETFTLSAIKTLEGKVVPEPSRALNISLSSRHRLEMQSGSCYISHGKANRAKPFTSDSTTAVKCGPAVSVITR